MEKRICGTKRIGSVPTAASELVQQALTSSPSPSPTQLVSVRGIEVQISDSHGTSKLTDHTSGGVIPKGPAKAEASKPAGEWNHFSITVKNDKLTVVLNGETVNEVDLTQGHLALRPKTGHLGFQDHGLPLWLKEIKIRELK